MANTDLNLMELIISTERHLLNLGYTKKYRDNLNRVYRKLIKYASLKEINQMSYELLKTFSMEEYGIDINKHIPNRDYVVRSLQMLLDYQNSGHISSRRVPLKTFPSSFSDFFENYYESTSFDKADITLKTYHNQLRNIAGFFEDCGLQDISQVDEAVIRNFATFLSKYSQSHASRHISILSHMMKYAYENAYHTRDLSSACIKVKTFRDSNVPFILTHDEVEKLLDSIDRSTIMGKRDYAILTLAARTGLRTGDIQNLRLSSFRWDKNTIEVMQSKTRKTLVLPLLEDVGLAIIDYIKFSRPQSDSDFLFLGTRAPFAPMKSPMNRIVKKYLQMIGIADLESKRPGLHTLRHSLASRLLEENISLTVISDVLGHSNSNTTKRYLKVDLEKLLSCALEVPHV